MEIDLDLTINTEMPSQIEQTTGLKRNTIDKYYTKPNIATQCINLIKTHVTIGPTDLIIEPSAGNGAFITQIKYLSTNYKFYDLEPEHDEIVRQNFLELDTTQLQTDTPSSIHVVGNPPFGRQSSLAIKFIKKCCQFAKSISFILPKSFKKESMQKHFAKNFHLVHEYDLPTNSFLVNNIECDVPCVFQIWVHLPTERTAIIKVEPRQFTFVKKEDAPDISFRRVGVNAGTISTDISNKSEQSHYFIKFTNALSLETNLDKLKNIRFTFNNTVGAKSISKGEVITQFNSLLE
jgi:predicted RNA methylase